MVLAATVICGAALFAACSHNGKTDAKKPPAREYVCDDDIGVHNVDEWLQNRNGDEAQEEDSAMWIHYGLD